MDDDDESVRRQLLSHQNFETMNSATVENEKGSGSGKGGPEPNLALHDAVCDPDNIEEIETLIEDEPHLLFEKDLDGRTPLITLAIDADNMAPRIAKLLLGVEESGEDVVNVRRQDLINIQDEKFGRSALHYAALNRQEPLVKVLVKCGADPYSQDSKGNTALHFIAQGMKEIAVQCATHLLQADVNKVLINVTNGEGKSALHKAVDERSTIMSKFLLRPENKFNISQKDEKNGWTILHYLCSSTEEPESLCEIAKAIIVRCSRSQLNEQDNKGRTALHLCAIQRLPKLADILVGQDNTDVLKVDERGRTALHYACIGGCYPKGSKCVEVLINRKFGEGGEQRKYLFRMEDSEGQTPFMTACISCSSDTVEKYMNIAKEPHTWMTGTYLTLLYKHCPLALKTLMDNAFLEDEKRSADVQDEILVDYGPITGYADTVDVLPQQETSYLKRALYWEYEPQKEILLHPLVQLFMTRKWHKLRWIIVTWVLWQLIWLAAFTCLIVSFYSKEETQSKPVALVSSAVMLIYILSSLVNEGFELYTVKGSYLGSLTNMTQLFEDLLALIAISPILTGQDSPQTWQKYATATGILLAYILSMRDIGKLHKKIGLVVEVLKQVLIQIVHVLLCCAPLWIGFTLAFVVIFDDDEALNSTFPGPIVKVLVMMTGEFEYNDTFKDDEGGKGPPELTSHRVVRLLFFLSFLISVPVAFFNLLTGFALDKVMELRERAKVGRIAKQLEHIYFIESILLSLRPLRKILPFLPYERCIRSLNVTTAWIDQKNTFYTTIREQVRKQDRGNKLRVQGCLAGLIPSFCSEKVPPEVEEQIFSLATLNSNPDLQAVEAKCPWCLKQQK